MNLTNFVQQLNRDNYYFDSQRFEDWVFDVEILDIQEVINIGEEGAKAKLTVLFPDGTVVKGFFKQLKHPLYIPHYIGVYFVLNEIFTKFIPRLNPSYKNLSIIRFSIDQNIYIGTFTEDLEINGRKVITLNNIIDIAPEVQYFFQHVSTQTKFKLINQIREVSLVSSGVTPDCSTDTHAENVVTAKEVASTLYWPVKISACCYGVSFDINNPEDINLHLVDMGYLEIFTQKTFLRDISLQQNLRQAAKFLAYIFNIGNTNLEIEAQIEYFFKILY